MKNLSLWLPFVYAMALSVIVLRSWSQSTTSLPAGSPAFMAFLPMAFFFSALSIQTHISKLEKRIESLEKQAGPKMGESS